MNKFIFTKNGKKEFKKLDELSKGRIIQKLVFLKSIDDITSFLKPLQNFKPANHRLRVGNLRIILQKNKSDYYVLDIGNRGNIYK